MLGAAVVPRGCRFAGRDVSGCEEVFCGVCEGRWPVPRASDPESTKQKRYRERKRYMVLTGERGCNVCIQFLLFVYGRKEVDRQGGGMHEIWRNVDLVSHGSLF